MSKSIWTVSVNNVSKPYSWNEESYNGSRNCLDAYRDYSWIYYSRGREDLEIPLTLQWNNYYDDGIEQIEHIISYKML